MLSRELWEPSQHKIGGGGGQAYQELGGGKVVFKGSSMSVKGEGEKD